MLFYLYVQSRTARWSLPDGIPSPELPALIMNPEVSMCAVVSSIEVVEPTDISCYDICCGGMLQGGLAEQIACHLPLDVHCAR